MPVPVNLSVSGVTATSVRLNWVRGVFNPASLFASGERGPWYDFSDLSTMFQDAAGTTPVTANGDPLGLVLDKSGNGIHASQSVSGRRMIYGTDGTLHWIQGNGVNQSLVTSDVDFTNTDTLTIFSGTSRVDSTARVIAEFSQNTNNNSGSFFLISGNNVSFNAYSSFSRGSSAPNQNQTAGYSNANFITEVVSATHNIQNNLSTMRVDGITAIDGTGNKGIGNFGNYPLFIAARNQSSLFFNGRIHQLIVRGVLSTADEITNTELYIAEKSGVTL